MKIKCGKPGIGATGQQGIYGKDGTSFYVGKLDSSKFFTYITQEMLDEYNLSNINISYSKDEKRLHPKYKEGDTILVLDDTNVITKKIELTKDHILCTEDFLLSTSGESYPLSIQYFDIDNKDVVHFPLNINNVINKSLYVLNDKYGSAMINGKSINNDSIKYDTSNKIDSSISYYTYIPEIFNTNSNYVNYVNNGAEQYVDKIISILNDTPLISLINNDTSNNEFNINANNHGLVFNTSDNKLKIKNLYIKKTNKGNVEAVNALYNDNIKLDTNGNCYTLNINDYNANTQYFTIDKSNFFNDTNLNIDDYHFGYIHTMYNGNDPSVYYHPNYITSMYTETSTYIDISTYDDGSYKRNWDDPNYIKVHDDTIKDILTNLTDLYTLEDVYYDSSTSKYYDIFNKSLFELYKDCSGIIITDEITKQIQVKVLKDLDGSILYKDYNLYNKPNTVYDSSKLSYESSIINVIDPSILTIDLTLKDKTGKNYYHHDIVQWVQVPSGIKYYSKPTHAIYDEYSNTYNIITEQQEYNNNVSDDKNVFTYELSNKTLTITDNDNVIDDISAVIVYVNNNKETYTTSNNSITVNINDLLSDNKINDTYINNTSILDDLYNSSIHKVNGYTIPVTVEYKTSGSDVSLYDYYHIKSQEYTELRTLPKINLHIYDDIDSLEKFNDVNKGLLCNQFQFFMKVSVDDFGQENWGQFDNDAKLTFVILEDTYDIFTKTTIGTINPIGIVTPKLQILSKDTDIFNITCKEISNVYIKNYTCGTNISMTINDDKEFYIRVLLEFANPEPAVCHFAYNISEMHITVKNEYETSLSTKGIYKSNHLYATIMPISMIAEYNQSNDTSAYRTTSSIKWYGSEDPITVSINPYKIKDIEKMYSQTRQTVNWNSYKLKNRYFQDNVESLYINPININDFYDKLPTNMYNESWLAKDEDDVYKTYLEIAYNSSDYNPTLIEDEEIFYFNNEIMLNSKYNQVGNNTALFVEQNIQKDIRNKLIISALSIWNNEYKALYYKESDNPYKGHNSVYGNGYQYLPSNADQGQYASDDVISLEDLKLTMDKNTLDNNIFTTDINHPQHYDNYTPDKMYYALNHIIKWAYPKYHTYDNISYIESLDISTAVMSNTTDIKEIEMMPYNLMYSIYPRVLYNDEEQSNIILMLRKPSVTEENTYTKGIYNVTKLNVLH